MTDDEKDLFEAAAKGVSDAALEPIKKPLMNIAGPFTEEVGKLLALPFKWWRFTATLAIMEKAQALLNQRGVQPNKVPMKLLATIVEGGGLEEDPGMVDRWASLLAAAADPTFKEPFLPSFPEILKQLSPKEVAILEKCYGVFIQSKEKNWHHWLIPIAGNLDAIGLSKEELAVAVDNLARLRLVTPIPETQRASIAKQLYLTNLGFAFVSACRSQSDEPIAIHVQNYVSP
jgi:hypothetical protein